jgi:MYXO-CTERM domain-containing protein
VGCRENALAVASADECLKDSKEFTLKKNSLTLLTIGACSASAMLSSGASAAIATYSQFSLWGQDVVASGSTVGTETFNSYDGYYASPLTGSVGGINWSATATGGIFCNSTYGYFSTNNPVAATFTFAPGVMAVGANIFGTNSNFDIVAARITVTLADGSSYIASTSVPTDFVGFISNGAAISSLTMNAVGAPGSNVYVTADNMYFGVVGVVPAPGAVALIGLAGLVASRRRRN